VVTATPARIRSLRRRRDRLQRDVRALEQEIEKAEKQLGDGARRRHAVKRRPNARRLNEVTVADAVVQLLRERKKPMHYKDITRTLLEEGRYRTRSRSFLSTVAISIQRDRRVRRVEPGIYTLRRGV